MSKVKCQSPSNLEGSRPGTNTIIDHSAIVHTPNIRHVAVCFDHTIDIEAISVHRMALVLGRDLKPSITAGNSAIEQRKQLPTVFDVDHCPGTLPVRRIAGG